MDLSTKTTLSNTPIKVNFEVMFLCRPQFTLNIKILEIGVRKRMKCPIFASIIMADMRAKSSKLNHNEMLLNALPFQSTISEIRGDFY